MDADLIRTLIAISGKPAAVFVFGGDEDVAAKYFKCFTAPANNPPASAGATLSLRNNHPILLFDDTTPENAIFADAVPSSFLAAGGLAITIIATSSAVTGNAIVQVAIERDNAGFDIDADSFAAGVTGTYAAPGSAGQLVYVAISLSSSQIDGLAAGERYRIKVTRNANDVGDTMVGDLEIVSVVVQEV